MSRLRLVLTATAAAAALSAGTAATSSAAPFAPNGHGVRVCAGARTVVTRSDARVVSRATLCLLNRERARYGLGRLRAQPSLTHAAAAYARTMVNQSFFAHVSPNGSTMAQRIKSTRYLHGVRDWTIGENLAWGAGDASTPAEIVNAWMHSPPHRRNILNPAFREIGIGIANGAPARAYAASTAGTYATEFGRRGR